MARRVDIETKTEELVLPIIEANNFELVDVEYVKEGANWYLRVYADKEGGIAILKENTDDQIVLTVEDQDITFDKKSIASARLSLDF